MVAGWLYWLWGWCNVDRAAGNDGGADDNGGRTDVTVARQV